MSSLKDVKYFDVENVYGIMVRSVYRPGTVGSVYTGSGKVK